MYRYLVFSDSHGSLSSMEKALDKYPDLDVIFLGDGLSDIETLERLYPSVTFLRVAGNNDRLFPDAASEIVIPWGKHRLFCTHGHKYSGRAALAPLLSAAKGNHCDVLLYGHTHRAILQEAEGITVLNPGSVGFSGSYALLGENNGELTAEIVKD